eukprot:g10154.t1
MPASPASTSSVSFRRRKSGSQTGELSALEVAIARDKPRLIQDALAHGLAQGVGCFRGAAPAATNTSKNSRAAADFLNYALTPHPIPRKSYEYLYHRGTPLNLRLYDLLSLDPAKFLFPALQEARKHDEITDELLKIAERIFGTSTAANAAPRAYADELRMFIVRNDYMMDADFCLKQIELNTFAASFQGMSEEVGKLQKLFRRKWFPSSYYKNGDRALPQGQEEIERDLSDRAFLERYYGSKKEAVERRRGSSTFVSSEEVNAVLEKCRAAEKRQLGKRVLKVDHGSRGPSSGGRGDITSSPKKLKNAAVVSSASNGIACGFGTAFRDLKKAYEEMHSSTRRGSGVLPPPELAVIFVADEDEKNELDQRKLERAMLEVADVISFRRSFAELSADFSSRKLVLEQSTNALYYFCEDDSFAGAADGVDESSTSAGSMGSVSLQNVSSTSEEEGLSASSSPTSGTGTSSRRLRPSYEVLAVYFRSGYWPEHYHNPLNPTVTFWSVRYFLEKSRAVKVPSCVGQLIGMKKIQQILYEEAAKLVEEYVATGVLVTTRSTTVPRGTTPSTSSTSSASHAEDGTAHNITADAVDHSLALEFTDRRVSEEAEMSEDVDGYSCGGRNLEIINRILPELLPFTCPQFDAGEELEKHRTRKLERRELDLLLELGPVLFHFLHSEAADLPPPAQELENASTFSRSTTTASKSKTKNPAGDFATLHPTAHATLTAFFPNLQKPLLRPSEYVMKSQIEGSGAVIVGQEMQDLIIDGVHSFLDFAFRKHGLCEKTDSEGAPISLAALRPNLFGMVSGSRRTTTSSSPPPRSTIDSIMQQEAAMNKLDFAKVNRLSEYIVMKKVDAPCFPQAVLVRSAGSSGTEVDVCYRGDAVGELGIFAAYIGGPGGSVLKNESYGHLLRSKSKKTEQGGVFLGHAVVDAPILV